MVFSPKTLSVLVLIALGLCALLLIVLVMMSLGRKGRGPGVVQTNDVMRSVLEGHVRTFQRIEAAIKELKAADSRAAERMRGNVQRVGLIRYDAFEDVGGRLSFSCALLDDRGDGVVMTSINGRQDTRVYAKPVKGGQSEYNLSEEEVEAIREAMAEATEKVEAKR